MKKIFVGKNENVAEVVEKILGSDTEEIILVVPKDSVLGESVSNFHLLKREAESAAKKLLVESVDEEILALAKASRLVASHPLFEGERRSSAISDIVLRGAARGEASEGAEKAALPQKRKPAEDAAAERRSREIPKVVVKSSTKNAAVAEDAKAETPPVRGRRRHFGKKLILATLAAVIVIGVAVWAVDAFFGRATVTINFKKTPWLYEHAFVADISTKSLNFDKNTLPGELFSSQKNGVKSYPASGVSNVSQKATGKITIYNAYSSEPQTLVATTRFSTPDGKIFRITNQVVVPGAEIKNGSITPASIDTGIVAATSGPEYNLGPVPRLTIPGFKGTPRYAGFYGEIKTATSGGYVGKKMVPTAIDISAAKDKITKDLRDRLLMDISPGSLPGFNILNGAWEINVTKLSVNENTNASGSFSVFAEANIKAIGFKESDLKSFLTLLVSKNSSNTVLTDMQLNYGQAKPDFKLNILSFNLSARGSLKPAFSPEDFKSEILGQKTEKARTLISGLPGLSDAKISLWPVWLTSIPSAASRVTILTN